MRLFKFAMLVFLFSASQVYSQTGLVNITIDDSFADPLTGVKIFYGLQNEAGPGDWVSVIGQNCTGCLAQPDAAQAFDHSWHDSTYSVSKGYLPSAWVTFTGSAVYVMGIIVSSLPQTNFSLNNTRLFFEIDGENQGSYLHVASNGPDIVFSYDTLFFAKEDLSYGLHNITIMVGDTVPAPDSLCLLDRIIYTTRSNSTVPGAAEGPGSGTNSGISTTEPTSIAHTSSSSGSNSGGAGSQNSASPASSSQHTPTQSAASSFGSQTQINPSGSRHPSIETIIIVVLGIALLFLVASGIYARQVMRKRRLESTIPAVTESEVHIEDSRGIDSLDEDPPSYLDSIGVTTSPQPSTSRSDERVSPHIRDVPDMNLKARRS